MIYSIYHIVVHILYFEHIKIEKNKYQMENILELLICFMSILEYFISLFFILFWYGAYQYEKHNKVKCICNKQFNLV